MEITAKWQNGNKVVQIENRGGMNKTFFIINDLKTGASWIEDFANDEYMLNYATEKLNGNMSFETGFHAVFGPYTENEANERLASALRLIAELKTMKVGV